VNVAIVGDWPPPQGGVSVHVAALAGALAGAGVPPARVMVVPAFLSAGVVASATGHRPPGCLLFAPGDARGLAGRMLEASRTPPPRGQESLRDPFEALTAIYEALSAGRPIPSDSAQVGGVPCSPV